MSEPLNYRPSNSAVYYRPLEQFNRRGLLIGLPIGVVSAVIGSAAYALILPTLRDGVVHVIAACVAAGAVALIAWSVSRAAKLRSPTIAAFLGAAISLLSLYTMWVAWIPSTLKYSGLYWQLVAHPFAFFKIIRVINRFGTWSYNGDQIRGFPLLIIWLIEAGMMLSAGVFAAIVATRDHEPICPVCRAKLASKIKIPKFAATRQDELVAAIEARTFEQLAAHEPPTHEHAPEVDIWVLSCPTCMETHVLSVKRLAWGRNKQGRLELKTTPLVNDLMITPVEAVELHNIAEVIRAQRRAIVPAQVVRSDADDPMANEST